jgi:microcystin-dependent protein
MEGVIGVVTCFAGAFIPKNWMACNGQSLSIPNNKPLFTIIGNAFGGDGVSTFNLPDLRGRTPVSPGVGQGSNYKQGQPAGAETLIVTANQLPEHTHSGSITVQLQANSQDGIDPNSTGGYPSRFTGAYSTTANCAMAPPPTFPQCGPAGSQPANTCSPYQVINYIICIAGVFPTRN